LVVRTLAATFVTVALVLGVVFTVILLDARKRVRESVAERLAAGQRALSAFEARRQRDLYGWVAILAESPTLKAALDTYATERGAQPLEAIQLRETVQREIEKLVERVAGDAVVVTDVSGRIVAVAGHSEAVWPIGQPVPESLASDTVASDRVIELSSAAFRLISVPLALADAPIGALHLATALDDGYAADLSLLSGAETAVVLDHQVIATTLDAGRAVEVSRLAATGLPPEGIVTMADDAHAVRRLFRVGAAEFYAFSAVDPAAAQAMQDAFGALAWIAAGAMLLAGGASLVLARTLSRPIDRLTRAIVALRREGNVRGGVVPSGSSRELDALAVTFNDLMASVAAAHEETRAAYVGAIRALAAALDARDPCTSGHSERVSALSVAIGAELGLSEEDLEILRLGALLHDIGKIGISDAVLRKPGSLTPEEFEVIKQHPTMGARILRPISFLAPHLPIVELHHEAPDGSGYPRGLRGDEIPLVARIVHVADAFDAITSARAYRPAWSATKGLSYLWRTAGSKFDAETVAALVRVLPSLRASDDTNESPAGASNASEVGALAFVPPARPVLALAANTAAGSAGRV
jgi:putative nucleotidyltransferase with HDIG domain